MEFESDYETGPLTPISELDEMFYNCTQCNSLIEIISLNEETNTIKFRCLN